MIVHGLFPFPTVSLHQARFGFNIYKYLDFTEMWSPFFVIGILNLYSFGCCLVHIANRIEKHMTEPITGSAMCCEEMVLWSVKSYYQEGAGHKSQFDLASGDGGASQRYWAGV